MRFGRALLLLLEAKLCLVWTRLGVLVLPFPWLIRALRQKLGETPTADDPATRPQRQRVAWALRRIGGRARSTNHCLAQALAGKQMLRRRGVTSTLYLGVAKDGPEKLEGHAWLRSGELTLTGAGDLDRYAVIATFAD